MKKDHMLFPIIFIIYIVAGLSSIVLFYTKGSNLSRQLNAAAVVDEQAPAGDEPDADSAEHSSNEVVGEVSAVFEPADSASDSAGSDETAEEISELSDTDTQPDDEPDAAAAEADSNAAVPDATDSNAADSDDSDSNTTDSDASGTADAADDTDTADETSEPDDGTVYYAFSVNKNVSAVRIRESEGRNSSIVGRVSSGDKGYILEKGDTRSKIVTEDGSITGYIYNEYIQISEIPKEEYPEEYR